MGEDEVDRAEAASSSLPRPACPRSPSRAERNSPRDPRARRQRAAMSMSPGSCRRRPFLPCDQSFPSALIPFGITAHGSCREGAGQGRD